MYMLVYPEFAQMNPPITGPIKYPMSIPKYCVLLATPRLAGGTERMQSVINDGLSVPNPTAANTAAKSTAGRLLARATIRKDDK